MPNQPKTPARSVRVGVDLWNAAKAVAATRGETVTDVIVRALQSYVQVGAATDLDARAQTIMRCRLDDTVPSFPFCATHDEDGNPPWNECRWVALADTLRSFNAEVAG